MQLHPLGHTICISSELSERMTDNIEMSESVEIELGKERVAEEEFVQIIQWIRVMGLTLMSVSFLVGSSLLPGTLIESSHAFEAVVFMLLAVLLFFSCTILDALQKRPKTTRRLQKVSFSLSLATSLFWMFAIGSIFMHDKTSTNDIFCGLWLIGSIFNLAAISLNITSVCVEAYGRPNLFTLLALIEVFVANVLFFTGACALSSMIYFSFMDGCLQNAITLFVIASLFYLIHALFELLALWYPSVVVTVENVEEQSIHTLQSSVDRTAEWCTAEFSDIP